MDTLRFFFYFGFCEVTSQKIQCLHFTDAFLVWVCTSAVVRHPLLYGGSRHPSCTDISGLRLQSDSWMKFRCSRIPRHSSHQPLPKGSLTGCKRKSHPGLKINPRPRALAAKLTSKVWHPPMYPPRMLSVERPHALHYTLSRNHRFRISIP